MPSMNTTRYKLKVEFITGPLGTQPQKNVATEHITSKAADPVTGALPTDELETLPEALEKGTTAFHKLNGKPILYDYQIRGFLKDAGMTFNGLRDVKNLRSKIEKYVFVEPRQIALVTPEGWMPSVETLAEHPEAVTDYCERPLRAQTAQGPRTALARSEMLPAGTTFECFLVVYDSPISEPLLRDLLSYGQRNGIGQWRGGGYGNFNFTLEKLD